MKINISILLVIIYLGCYEHTFAQEWGNNGFSNFFKEKKVLDVSASNDTFWLLTENGLYRYKAGLINKYQIDTSSHGYLKDFEMDVKEFKNQFENIYLDEDVVWLTSSYKKKIIKIKDDYLYEYTLPVASSYRFIFNLDSNGALWILSYSNKFMFPDSSDYFRNKIFKIGDKITELTIPDEIQDKYVSNFVIDDNLGYFIYFDHNSPVLLKTDFSFSLKTMLDTPPNAAMTYQIKFFDNKLYILSSNSILYILDQEHVVREILNIETNFRVDFVISIGKIFVPTFDGLGIYNLETKDVSLTIPPSFVSNCYYGFNRIVLSGKTLILVYGGVRKYDCNSNLSGFALFFLK